MQPVQKERPGVEGTRCSADGSCLCCTSYFTLAARSVFSSVFERKLNQVCRASCTQDQAPLPAALQLSS
eukprot:6923715-Pyramimonas_sp.AAC.1